MNIVLNYDPVAAANPSFVADAQAAVAILNRTFTNNITLTFDVGLGSILQWNNALQSFQRSPTDPNEARGNVNWFRTPRVTYSQLRTNLLTFGQPNFFTGANLPAGNSINGISDFYISSSVAAAFGLPVPPPRLTSGPTSTASSASAADLISPLAACGSPPSCTKSRMPWAASYLTSVPQASHTIPSWT